MITLASLYDGIGGWLLAAERNGIKPIWSSEIDPAPAYISHKHFPDVKQLGDITKITKAPFVDIICAGSPCQDLSVAGNREGLKGERSGLFLYATKLIWEMRRKSGGKYPRYFIWENVPGALSSNDGKDFQVVLEEILQTHIPIPDSGKWGGAGMVRTEKQAASWRILDAQFWGVPQRRKRIFLIANLAGNDGTEILFEPESLPGNPEKSQQKEEEDPGSGDESSYDPGRKDYLMDIANRGDGIRMQNGTSPTLTAYMGTGGLNVPILYQKKIGTLLARDYKGLNTWDVVADKLFLEGKQEMPRIRRLTPLECERLQGLPDNWTEGLSDPKRYKAIGNGMAQPCADFVLSCIVRMEEKGEGK